MFNPSTFKLAPLPSWQYSYRLMFSKERGQVNVPYELCVDHTHWCIPQGAKTPEDWDVIIEDYHLAVSRDGFLGVDDGTPENMNVITSFDEELLQKRSLYHCFVLALQGYWYEHGKHHSKLHSSWYDIVENFVE